MQLPKYGSESSPTMASALAIDAIIAELTLPEKIEILSGANACSTVPIPRLKIPKLQCSDGPQGLRGGGGRFFNAPKGYQLPAAIGMGATFDIELLNSVGKLLGDEGQAKGIHLATAPTVCIQRSPLLGRGYEAYAEDPVLSGTLAAHLINGLQECGVGSCIKHYAAHDQTAHGSQDSVLMSQRTLRELHILPFQLAFAITKLSKSGTPWSIMTSYNRINGIHCSEDPHMMNGILRSEWGWDGLVISDWWGTYSTSKSINAGLDLEMPQQIWRGRQLADAVECRKVSLRTVDKAVSRLLQLMNRTKAYKPPVNGEDTEHLNTKRSHNLTRKVAADSVVLLKNDKRILPLEKGKKQRYGLIGELFEHPATCGGGGSEVNPFYTSTPITAISEAVGAENIQYTLGCYTRRWTPLIEHGFTQPQSSKPGLLLEWFGEDPSESAQAKCVLSDKTTSTIMYFSQMILPTVPQTYFIRVKATYTAETSCKFRFGLSVCGRAKMSIDGKEVADLWKSKPEKTDETPVFNKFTMERFVDMDLEMGRCYDIEIVMTNKKDDAVVGDPGAGGVRLGGHILLDEDEAIKDAVEIARNVDVPIVMAGLSADWEYEGADRTDLLLPRRQNELIQRVVEANPNTIVVTQSGLPFEMPWLASTNTLVHAWYGGQETGHGIADVLFGDVNPSGRLSITFPKKVEDNPAFLTFGKQDRVLVYGEGVFVGYRYYEKLKREPLFYFGYGLSYTKFEQTNLVVPCVFDGKADTVVTVSVDVENVGERAGAEVVQVYVGDLECSVQRPRKELKAFTKVYLASGQKCTVQLKLDKYAVSFWSEELEEWKVEAGDFEVIIGKSSDPRDELLKARFTVPKTFSWTGL